MAAMPGLWIRILQVQVLMENKKEMRKAPMKKNKCPAFKMLDKIYSEDYTTTILTKYGVGKVIRNEHELAHCSLHAMNGGTKDSSLCFDLDRCMIINNQYKSRRKSCHKD